jgi:hypothetical protein
VLILFLFMLHKNWVRHIACLGKMRDEQKSLVAEPDRKRPFQRPRHRWEENIKIELIKIGCKGVDWIHLPQDRNQCSDGLL